MMQVKKLIFLFVLVFFPLAQAQQLVQFQPGTPAKAAEVNQNFTLLKQGLDNLASFENLTEAQVQQLQQSLAIPKGPSLIKTVNCQQNAGALMDAYASLGERDFPEHLNVTFEVSGACYAALSQQYMSLNLKIIGTGTAPTLIPHPQDGWFLLGGFNGGLSLSNLTLRPPAHANAVLLSRASMGSLTNVIIDGGGRGLLVQANAEATLAGVTILNTTAAGITVKTGGLVRYFASPLGASNQINTISGSGVELESAHFEAYAPLVITAPHALNLHNNASFRALYDVSLNGNLGANNGASMFAKNLTWVGNGFLDQAAILVETINSQGFINVHSASRFVANRGQMRAKIPFSSLWADAMLLEVTDGSSVRLGTWSETPLITVEGRLQIARGTLTLQDSVAHVHLHAEQSSVAAYDSQISSPVGFEITLNTSSSFVIHTSELDAELIRVNQSAFNSYQTTGNANFFGSSASIYLNHSNFPDSFLDIHHNSSFKVDHGTIAGFMLGALSSGAINKSEVTGNFQRVWQPQNSVSASSQLNIADSFFSQPKTINSHGIINFSGEVNLAGSALECFGRSFVQYWQTGSINAGSNNCQLE